MLAGRLVGAGGEVLVAAPSASALGDDDALVGLGEVVDQLAGLDRRKGRVPTGTCRTTDLAVEAGAVGAHRRVRRAAPLCSGL